MCLAHSANVQRLAPTRYFIIYLLICSTFRSWWKELGGNSVVKRDDVGQKTLSVNPSSENTLIASSDTTSRQHGTVLLSMKRLNTRFCSSDPFPFVWQIHVWYSFPRPDHRADLCGDTNSTAASNHVLLSIGQLCHHRQPRSISSQTILCWKPVKRSRKSTKKWYI